MDNKPTILIVVGITGDLSTRKVLPAISNLIESGKVPDDFVVLGVTRKPEVDVDKLLLNVEFKDGIKNHLKFFQMDLDSDDEYLRLNEKLKEIEGMFSSPSQHLFYLSVPPQVSLFVIEKLGLAGFAKEGTTKILLEKPFGVNLESAKGFVKQISRYFDEKQVYRIDHYLAKPMTQEVISFRDNDLTFKDYWNNSSIERIEIIASESIGIEGRISFYEQTGALIDLVQSHLLQLAAIMLMDINKDDLSKRKLQALKNLNIPSDKPITNYVHRGQYTKYKNEVNNNGSKIETYVSITLESNNPKWIGVPINIMTGKMLDKKATEIVIYYKKNLGPDKLIFRIQPDEGITFPSWSLKSDFNYSINHNTKIPEAYENVLTGSFKSDHSIFVSSEEVLESWRIIAPIQEAWKKSNDDLFIYEEGSNPYYLK
jgi:glucose-6-phosphate 1-dehydrogenase